MRCETRAEWIARLNWSFHCFNAPVTFSQFVLKRKRGRLWQSAETLLYKVNPYSDFRNDVIYMCFFKTFFPCTILSWVSDSCSCLSDAFSHFVPTHFAVDGASLTLIVMLSNTWMSTHTSQKRYSSVDWCTYTLFFWKVLKWKFSCVYFSAKALLSIVLSAPAFLFVLSVFLCSPS